MPGPELAHAARKIAHSAEMRVVMAPQERVRQLGLSELPYLIYQPPTAICFIAVM